MKPIKRRDAAEPLVSKKAYYADEKAKKLMTEVINDIGLSGFSSRGPLRELSDITRVVFVNKIRQEYLEDFFSLPTHMAIFHHRYKDDDIDIFETKCLTQAEKDFLMFNLDKMNAVGGYVDTKLFIKAHFKKIRTIEDLELLIIEDLGVG